MGNTSSAFSSGAVIAIKVNPSPFNNTCHTAPGEPLTGTVCLYVSNPEVSCETLHIRFSGTENVRVEYTVQVNDSDGKSHSETRHSNATSKIVDVVFPLVSFPSGLVLKGSYEFPFQIILPRGLPAKQYWNDRGNNYQISYNLEARLDRKGMFKWDVTNNHEIFVDNEKIISIPTPMYIAPTSVDVKFLCCINSGSMTLGKHVFIHLIPLCSQY